MLGVGADHAYSTVMGELGFSVVGAGFLLALFVPNLMWAQYARPRGYDARGEHRLLRLLERVGQVLVSTALLIFADTNLGPWSLWTWWFVGAAALMVLYELCWVRYFASDHTIDDFYRAFLGVPVPLALLPVLACLLLGVYGRLLPLILATVVFGIGHIGVHLQHRARIRQAARDGRSEAFS